MIFGRFRVYFDTVSLQVGSTESVKFRPAKLGILIPAYIASFRWYDFYIVKNQFNFLLTVFKSSRKVIRFLKVLKKSLVWVKRFDILDTSMCIVLFVCLVVMVCSPKRPNPKNSSRFLLNIDSSCLSIGALHRPIVC